MFLSISYIFDYDMAFEHTVRGHACTLECRRGASRSDYMLREVERPNERTDEGAGTVRQVVFPLKFVQRLDDRAPRRPNSAAEVA